MGAHINYRSKVGGGGFGVFYDSGLCKDGLNFVTGGKYPASTIKYHTALGLVRGSGLLLSYRGRDVVVGLEVLQVKAASCE
jgi:hypothetical protein